jgi:hypothetical protein
MRLYTQKKLAAGQPGTRKWQKLYGDRLVCVRYKYDLQNRRKIKTVELVVENEPWNLDINRKPANKIVAVKIAYWEVSLGKLIRAAGGRWNRQEKVWELPYREVVNLGLHSRLVKR